MLCVAMVLSAQEVDKATVTAQADAAKAAVGDLSKLTVGEESPKLQKNHDNHNHNMP